MIPDGTGVYAIENVLRPWAYVGATKIGFRQRWRAHLSAMRSHHHQNKGLQHDARYYGTCAFRFVVLQELPIFIDYAPFEQFWVHYLRQIGIKCYNMVTPCERPVYQIDVSEVPAGYSAGLLSLSLELRVSETTIVRYLKRLPSGAVRTRWRWYISPEGAAEVARLIKQRRLERRLKRSPEASAQMREWWRRKRELAQFIKDYPIC